jgi:uracil phosphoribosyltransferase
MRVAMGSDHAGFSLKEAIKTQVQGLGHEVTDVGAFSGEKSVDYPDWSMKVTSSVASDDADRGILICGTGIGMSISANKVAGIYAALCNSEFAARMSRLHNGSNVLVLGSRTTGLDVAKAITEIWLATEPEGGRHLIRRQKVRMYEEESLKSEIPARGAGRVVIIEHPLIQHKIGIIRDKNTGIKDFRDLVQEIASLMVYEISRNLPLEEVDVETPVCSTKAFSLARKKIAIIPVLRSGLGMVEGVLRLVPNAKVGHIGLYKNPKTLRPVDPSGKLPRDIAERDVFVLDLMLATGSSASASIAHIKRCGAKRITLVSLIAAPEGVERVSREHPGVDIFSAALDSHVDENGYIVPGLGDAGDRLFGTM